MPQLESRPEDTASDACTPPALGATSHDCAVVQWLHGTAAYSVQQVVEETPVALTYNGVSYAVMLASPADLEDFALGFSLSEGIIKRAGDFEIVNILTYCEGIEIRMRVAERGLPSLPQRRRTLAGRTGCGLCGVEKLSEFTRPMAAVADGGTVTAQMLHSAMESLASQQHMHNATGAVHAAGWSTWAGEVSVVREDVGRHNALDKLIGALARQATDPATGFVLVTSRASYELVQKTASAGIRLIAAVSAPTALAVRLAERLGVTLAGFVRPGKHVVYSYPERIVDQA